MQYIGAIYSFNDKLCRGYRIMSQTLYRQFEMLRLIPRQPKRIGTRQLLELLQQTGFSTTQRTIQRDLN